MNSSAFLRKNFRLTVLASVVALGAFGASNSFAAEATATGTVIEPMTITNAGNLAFGKFARGATAGTVIVTTDGIRTQTGGVNLSNDASPVSAARFDVTGDSSATYAITWGEATTLTTGGGLDNETMALARISGLTPSGSTTVGDVESGTLTNGAQSIFLGGELAVGTEQIAGDYTGTVTVTVAYN